MIYSCSWPVYQIYAGISVSGRLADASDAGHRQYFQLIFFSNSPISPSALPQKQPNFSSIIEHCNLWRNFDDIQDSWTSLESIIDYYGNNQDAIVPNAGPGHWNDPDMVMFAFDTHTLLIRARARAVRNEIRLSRFVAVAASIRTFHS